jgi:hypothetical protein
MDLIRRLPEGSAERKTCAPLETLASRKRASAQRRRRTTAAPGRQIQSEREFGQRRRKAVKENKRNSAFICFQ